MTLSTSLFRNKIHIFSGNQIKLFAIICMTVQHMVYANIIKTNADFWISIGTMTLPLILFLLVEGYVHTSHRGKYALRLFIAMLISEIPFRLIFPFYEGESFYFGNIMATLLFNFILLRCFEFCEKNLLLLFGILGTSIFNLDYGFYSVLFTFSFYFFRKNNLCIFILTYILYIMREPHFIFGLVILLCILCYNGKISSNKNMDKKPKSIIKYGFYLFYPLHFILLYFINVICCS